MTGDMVAILGTVAAALAVAWCTGMPRRLGFVHCLVSQRKRTEALIAWVARSHAGVSDQRDRCDDVPFELRGDRLAASTRQLLANEAEPTVIRAMLEVEVEQIVLRRRVYRTVAYGCAATFPLMVVGATATVSVQRMGQAVPALFPWLMVGSAMVYGVMLLWMGMSMLAGRKRQERQLYQEVDLLATGAEMVLRGDGEEAIRRGLAVYLAQPWQASQSDGVTRKVA